MRENRGGVEMPFVGRDHNPGAYTLWMAGGGVMGGYSHGATDPSGCSAMDGKVSAHDFHSTLLTLLGFDHKKLTYFSQGADQRLSNITKPSKIVSEIFA
jgi:hypothetical protein